MSVGGNNSTKFTFVWVPLRSFVDVDIEHKDGNRVERTRVVWEREEVEEEDWREKEIE